MKKQVLAALLCALSAPRLPAQAATPARPKVWGPGRVGSYQPVPCDSPTVLAAEAYLQTQLAAMQLEEVTEAYTQVVAGLNVKLICTVETADGPAQWEFVAFRSLDQRWHFSFAQRLR